MLPAGWDTVRMFVHVLAATVWVGGQLKLAAVSGLSAWLHARARTATGLAD